MNKILIDVTMYILEMLFVFYYCESLFHNKHNKIISILTFTFENVILFLVYQNNSTYLNIILMFVLNAIAFKLLYDIQIKSTIFHSAIIIIVMLASEMFTMCLSNIIFKDFNALENDFSAYVFVISISKLIYFVVMLIILNLFSRHNSSSRINDKYFWMLFCIPLSSTLLLVSFRYITYSIHLSHTMSLLWSISSLITIVSNVLIFVIYNISTSNLQELFELKAEKIQKDQNKQHYEVLERSNEDMRILAHDIKNHLTQIRNMTDINEIENYIDCLLPSINKFSQIGITKNKMFDLIISKYQTLCDKKNINLIVDVKSGNLKTINDFDLSTIMNNLLDNAIESAEKSVKKQIKIISFSGNNQFDGLIIENSCDNIPKQKNNNLVSNKSNKILHGLGLKSVNKVLKEYNAIFDWNYYPTEKTFKIIIAFPTE